MKSKLLYLYLVVGLGELLSISLEARWMELLFKPLLMLVLGAFYYVSTAKGSGLFSRQVAGAIVFSWIGDVALLLESIHNVLFMVGLGSFLTAHILYILAYRQHKGESTDGVLVGIQKFRYSFPIILAGTGLITILYSHLGDLKIPVILYAVVLIAMVVEALFRYGYTQALSFWFVFVGALLFFISDSSIAIGKFMGSFNLSGILIMSTYILAQLFIVRGLVLHHRR